MVAPTAFVLGAVRGYVFCLMYLLVSFATTAVGSDVS